MQFYTDWHHIDEQVSIHTVMRGKKGGRPEKGTRERDMPQSENSQDAEQAPRWQFTNQELLQKISFLFFLQNVL
jgi:hypothetical protein